MRNPIHLPFTLFILCILAVGCSSKSPTPEEAGLVADPAIEEALLRAAPDYNAALVGDTKIPAKYIYRRIDLDKDGQDEVVVYLLGPFFCGTGGCNLVILKATDGVYKVMANLPTTQLPLIASPDPYLSWIDLYTRKSGGGAASRFVKYSYERGAYRQKGVVPSAGTVHGHVVLPDGVTYAEGLLLKPAL